MITGDVLSTIIYLFGAIAAYMALKIKYINFTNLLFCVMIGTDKRARVLFVLCINEKVMMRAGGC